jgi:hypothetical protein
MNTPQKPQLHKHSVICSDLSSDEWRRLAGRIDNDFFYSKDTFSVERGNGYYFLNTNKCDNSSFIMVFCEIGIPGISKIERLGDDTEGWQEIYPNTYLSVEKFLNEVQSIHCI